MPSSAILCSLEDPASVTIRESLLSLYDFKETASFRDNPILKHKNFSLYTLTEPLIHANNIDKEIKEDVLIFASKHRAASGIPSLSVHPIGNWNNNELGGEPKKLCPTPALLMRSMFLKIQERAGDSDFQITMEATHHGPYVEKPAVFIEIGSDEKNWKRKDAGDIIAKTILETRPEEAPVAVGFGGTHYCTNFNKRLEKVAISHVCPKHHLEFLDEAMIRQATEKTQEKVDFVMMDWKGLSPHKARLQELLEKMEIEYKRPDRI